jgi:hypothetical protein
MSTNLPFVERETSPQTKLFFDPNRDQPLEFLSTDVDAAIGFFESRGFDRDAATTVAVTILKQAKLEDEPVFRILDTLASFESMQISALVGEILNNNRPATSTLGFRVTRANNQSQERNILP